MSSSSRELDPSAGSALVAENSRLKALVLRMVPVVTAALELRKMGLAQEAYLADYDERHETGHALSRSYTVGVMLENAFEVALKAFDDAVHSAALSDFDEFRATSSAKQYAGDKSRDEQQ